MKVLSGDGEDGARAEGERRLRFFGFLEGKRSGVVA